MAEQCRADRFAAGTHQAFLNDFVVQVACRDLHGRKSVASLVDVVRDVEGELDLDNLGQHLANQAWMSLGPVSSSVCSSSPRNTCALSRIFLTSLWLKGPHVAKSV